MEPVSLSVLEKKKACHRSMDDAKLNQLIVRVEEPQGELSGGGDMQGKFCSISRR